MELPESHKQAILEYLNNWSKSHTRGIRWVTPENLHLTLLFIGDTHSGDLPGLKEALFDLMIKSTAFNLFFMGFELFPAKEPRIIWVKLNSDNRDIYNFTKDLTRIVKEFGYQPDVKSLKLHITVGRIKSPQQPWLEQEIMQSELPKEPAIYDNVTFYQSILKQEGPVYFPLQQYEMIRKNK